MARMTAAQRQMMARRTPTRSSTRGARGGSRRGFAAMDSAKQHDIAAKGGKAHKGMHYGQGNQNARGPHRLSAEGKSHIQEAGHRRMGKPNLKLKGNKNAQGPHSISPGSRLKIAEGGRHGGQAHKGMHYGKGNRNAAGPHNVSKGSRTRMSEGGTRGGQAHKGMSYNRGNQNAVGNRGTTSRATRSNVSKQNMMNTLRNRLSLKKVA